MFDSYIIGNGFSINLVNILVKNNLLDKNAIDLVNLFSHGDILPCPDDSIGYLSPIYCPLLWKNGARCFIDKSISNQIINNIICSYNVTQLILDNGQTLNNYESLDTYFELNRYLKNLFMYYNSIIKDDMLLSILDQIPIINRIKDNDVVISYNYDILFERLLSLKRGEQICTIEAIKYIGNIKIIKPHGSIDFILKEENIKKEKLYNYDSNKIMVSKKMENCFKNGHNQCALIIPPLGHISDKNEGWVKKIREVIKNELSSSPSCVIFYGLSYDIVDRVEINEIISFINKNASVIYINPFPSLCLDFIFSQHFKNYKHLSIERGGI